MSRRRLLSLSGRDATSSSPLLKWAIAWVGRSFEGLLPGLQPIVDGLLSQASGGVMVRQRFRLGLANFWELRLQH